MRGAAGLTPASPPPTPGPVPPLPDSSSRSELVSQVLPGRTRCPGLPCRFFPPGDSRPSAEPHPRYHPLWAAGRRALARTEIPRGIGARVKG